MAAIVKAAACDWAPASASDPKAVEPCRLGGRSGLRLVDAALDADGAVRGKGEGVRRLPVQQLAQHPAGVAVGTLEDLHAIGTKGQVCAVDDRASLEVRESSLAEMDGGGAPVWSAMAGASRAWSWCM